MSGLLFLTHEDFSIQKGKNGNIHCCNVPGLALMLFYSPGCEHCNKLFPVFKHLPGTINGCQFGIINVSTNRKIVEMSQNTVAPIKYVPYIVLYVNGRPFMMYKGEHTAESISRFVIDVAKNIEKKQQFSKEKVKENVDTGIPEYTIGKPITGGKDQLVCYLDFTHAYESKQN
jgi:thiol-disulfide isomerase/thioredoxin